MNEYVHLSLGQILRAVHSKYTPSHYICIDTNYVISVLSSSRDREFVVDTPEKFRLMVEQDGDDELWKRDPSRKEDTISLQKMVDYLCKLQELLIEQEEEECSDYGWENEGLYFCTEGAEYKVVGGYEPEEARTWETFSELQATLFEGYL